jgi:methylglutaconyl-CoA hydratase
MSDFPITDPWVENPAPDLAGPVILDASPSGVAVVMINRPGKKNAFDAATIAALREAFETLQSADQVRVVFLRGAGGVFCAGADLGWMADAAGWSEQENFEDARELGRMIKALYDLPALTVALVEGPAFGGGAGLVAACDTAVAVRGAKFAFSEVKLGLTPATISPYVVDAIGPRRARTLFATGEIFDADLAREIGLIHEVVDDAKALEAFMERISNMIMTSAPGAVADAKRLVWDVWGVPINNTLVEKTAHHIAKRRVSDEGREGVRAFLDKRMPSWAG